MDINKIYNEDCFDTMRRMYECEQKVDVILTSPPYCTPNDDARKNTPEKFKNHVVFYDVFEGFESPEAYRVWTRKLFNAYDTILAENGVILYNLSYSTEYPYLMWQCIADVINDTENDFVVADCITWKKNSALPQNRNSNRLTRVCELVFVIVRESELKTFKTTKEQYGRLQNNYTNLQSNYIEAPNNDILDTEVNKLNNATFSTLLVTELLKRYAYPGFLVYDSFMGLGTTAVACKSYGCDYIGSELSEAQIEFANKRLNGLNTIKKSRVKTLF